MQGGVMYNPYWGKSFFSFIPLFFQRFFYLITGRICLAEITVDELQFLVMALIAISCAVIGCFLYMRKMTMLANALSHTILLGIVIAYIVTKSMQAFTLSHSFDLTTMVFASIISALLTSFLSQFFSQLLRLQEDASIGIVFSSLFALGVLSVSLLTKNVHIGIEVIMGSPDVLHPKDLILSFKITLANLALVALFYRPLYISTFDAFLAKSFKVPITFLRYMLMLQTSITVVAAFRVVGVLLVLAFLVAPPMIARFYTKTFGSMLINSLVFSIFICFLSVALSRHFLSVDDMALSTAAIAVTLFFLSAIFSIFFAPNRGIAVVFFQRLYLKKRERITGTCQ